MRSSLVKAVESLKPHDHICLIYETEREWRSAIVPFMAIGLKRGEKCVYIVDSRTAVQLRKLLEKEGIDAKSAERSGQLVILHESEAYTREGSFDPERMIAFIISETKKAQSEGYSAFRVTSEMTWVLKGHPGSGKLIEYEAKLNSDLFPAHSCVAICQYDRRRFEPEIIQGVMMTHPYVIWGKHLYENIYYMPPEELLSAKKAERQVEHWLNTLESTRRARKEGQEIGLAFITDITEKMTRKKALRESEERFRNIYSQSPIGIELYDLDGKLVDVNPAYLDIFGISDVEDVRGFNLFKDPNLPIGAKEKLLRGETIAYESRFNFEVAKSTDLLRTSKLGSFYIECTISPFRGADARPIGFLAYVKDITSRKQFKFDSLIADLSARLMTATAERLNEEIKQGLERLAEMFDANLAALFEYDDSLNDYREVYTAIIGDKLRVPDNLNIRFLYPWAVQEMRAGRTLSISSISDLPPEAAQDRSSYERMGITAFWSAPLQAAGGIRYVLCLASQIEHLWPDELLPRLRTLGAVFASAIERCRAEEKLRAAELKYRTVAEFTSDWEDWSDREGNFVYVSLSCERISGFYPREFMERPALFREIIVPEDRELWDRHRHEIQDDIGIHKVHFRIQRRDGEIRWIEHICQPIRDEKGRFEGFRASNRDATTNKEAEEKLRLSEMFLKRAQEVAQLGSWYLDIVRNELIWSDEVYKIFGICKTTPLSYEIFLYSVHPEDRAYVDASWNEALEGKPYDIEHRIVVPGQEKWVREKAVVEFGDSGTPLRGIGIVQDITHHKQREEQIRELQEELRRSTRTTTMGELAAALTHELNQPLTGIISNAQAAQHFLSRANPDPAGIGEILADIVQDGIRAGDIVKKVRALFKKDQHEFETLEINKVIDELVPLVRSKALISGVSFSTELDNSISPVRGDRVQLQQVLLNLALNAFEAMERSEVKKLCIRTSQQEPEFVTVCIEDSGTGIDDDKKEKIFAPFYTTKKEGMGMGLSICSSIVKTHFGRIWTHNNPDRGATFYFTLPAAHGD